MGDMLKIRLPKYFQHQSVGGSADLAQTYSIDILNLDVFVLMFRF